MCKPNMPKELQIFLWHFVVVSVVNEKFKELFSLSCLELHRLHSKSKYKWAQKRAHSSIKLSRVCMSIALESIDDDVIEVKIMLFFVLA